MRVQPLGGLIRLKVCCIAGVEEARLAVRHGASALGLVSAMPSGPGVIPEARIREIAAAVPPGVASFLLTSKQSAAEIIDQQRRTRVNTLQLCDDLAEGSHTDLRAELPGVVLVQVIHVRSEDSIAEALAAAPHVDALLLDSGDKRAAVRELGGTGRVHDWSVSRSISEAMDRMNKPVFLAGGLTPQNVARAVEAVRPYAVDVCSGLRTEGRLDEEKLAAFTRALWGEEKR